MSIALLAVGIIVFLCGCSILSVAKSSIHEIEEGREGSNL